MLHPRQSLAENGRLQGPAERLFWGTAGLIALTFCALFFTLVVPPVVSTSDFMRAALFDGFVNPTARGYTLDTLCTGLLVLAWIAYERVRYGIRHGWIAALLVFVPGVVVGLAVYLWLRSRHAAERLEPGHSRRDAAETQSGGSRAGWRSASARRRSARDRRFPR